MASTQQASGSQACTIATEHTLNSGAFTTAGAYQLELDTNALADGESLEWQYVVKTLTGSTERACFRGVLTGGSLALVQPLPIIPICHSIKFIINQLNGTGRTIDWSVRTTGATVSQNASGTQAATISSTHNLATGKTINGVLFIDANAMVKDDELLVEILDRAISSGTTRVAYRSPVFKNAQGCPVLVSPLLLATHDSTYRLTQIAGTGRSFDWSLVQVG